MHRALLISELVCHICDLLMTDSRSTVAALTRAARALHEPAVDALWRVLGSEGLINLLRCMPRDLWVEETTLYEPNIYFVRNITPSDWNRLFFYAYHVRDVQNAWLPRETMDQFLDSLSAQHPGIDLFPNLRRALIDCDDRIAAGRLSPTLLLKPGSKLKDIHILTDPEGMSSICELATNVRPPLERLEITVYPDMEPTECPLTFLGILQALPYLKSLVLELPWSWFPVVAARLSSLPCLKELHIQPIDDLPEDGLDACSTPSHWPSSPFPSLRCLRFYFLDLGYFSTAMQSIFPPRLDAPSLRLYSISNISADQLERALKIISDTFNPTTLTELDIAREGEYPIDDDQAIEGPLFEPFLAFTGLQTVSLDCDRLCIGDRWLKNMADAWPHLKHLCIASNDYDYDFELPGSHSDAYVTVDGLSYLASSCQNLLSLTCRLKLDSEGTKYLQARDGGPGMLKQYDNRLEDLKIVSHSVLSGTTDATNVLSSLFPRLHTFAAAYYEPELKGPCEAIQALLRAKAQERNILG